MVWTKYSLFEALDPLGSFEVFEVRKASSLRLGFR